MNIYEAFVYEWTNISNGMKYIGSHKGNIEDGYISSSQYFLNEYNKNIDNFSRKIVATGSIEEMRFLETKLLEEVDAANNQLYYNKHNQNGKFICLSHSEKTKKKMKGRIPWNKGKKGVYSEETLNKMSQVAKGRIIRPKDSKLSEDTKRKLSDYKGEKHHFYGKTREDHAEKMRGRKHSEETKLKMKIAWEKRRLQNAKI